MYRNYTKYIKNMWTREFIWFRFKNFSITHEIANFLQKSF